MFCEQCGKDIPENSKFCAGCGAKVEPAETVVEAIEPDPQPTPPPKTEPTTPPKAEQTPPPAPQPVPVSAQKIPYNQRGNLVKPLSIGAYLGMIILLCIPVVNLIMLLVWSFSDSVNINKKHFAIANLILVLVGIVISIVLAILMVRLGFGFYDWYYNF